MAFTCDLCGLSTWGMPFGLSRGQHWCRDCFHAELDSGTAVWDLLGRIARGETEPLGA